MIKGLYTGKSAFATKGHYTSCGGFCWCCNSIRVLYRLCSVLSNLTSLGLRLAVLHAAEAECSIYPFLPARFSGLLFRTDLNSDTIVWKPF